MNFKLSEIPHRSIKPRSSGLTMITDRGLSVAETENILSISARYIDIVKLAFGTALVTTQLKEKIAVYKACHIPVFFGGLLFEAYLIRNQLKEFIKLTDHFDINFIEVSDGEINISHDKKCDFIRTLSKHNTVISEIGSKDKDKVQITPPYQWIKLMQNELDAGSSYVIAEAKEMGHDGLYRNSGEVREGLVEEILTKIPDERIIWEAPDKDQQLYFIKRLGCNANLGNIDSKEVIALETMRIGLRSDSFDLFLNK